MSQVSIYLNFEKETEAAFNFYREIFGGEFQGGIMRFRESRHRRICLRFRQRNLIL